MSSDVCFRPLFPKLESELDIVWKKCQVFSPAAKTFLEALRRKFIELNNTIAFTSKSVTFEEKQERKL